MPQHLRTVTHSARAPFIAAGMLTAAFIGSASAMPLKDYFTDLTRRERTHASQLSFTTEAYRAQNSGNQALAQCIADNFTIHTGGDNHAPSSLIQFMDRLDNNRDRTDQHVEGYITSYVDYYCNEGRESFEPKNTIEYTPIDYFMSDNVTGKAKTEALKLAISTQAFRENGAGNEDRAQCISANFLQVQNVSATEGQSGIPFGLENIVRSLKQNADRSDRFVEGYIVGHLNHTCPVTSFSQPPSE